MTSLHKGAIIIAYRSGLDKPKDRTSIMRQAGTRKRQVPQRDIPDAV
jgi:hypothetical protein